MDPIYSLTGLLVGVLVGLTGMGGGSLMTPLLVLLVGIKPTVAIGSDLAYAAFTKLVGWWQHHRTGQIDYKVGSWLAVGSVPGSLLGVKLVGHLEKSYGDAAQHYLTSTLGAVLVVVGAFLIIRLHPTVAEWLNSRSRSQQSDSEKPAWLTTVYGALLGFIVGVTSVGSGTLFGVLLLTLYRMKSLRMVGTDVYHATLLTTAAASAHFAAGRVDVGLVANLLVGSIPGVILGSRLAAKLPERRLKPVLASVLVIAGIKML